VKIEEALHFLLERASCTADTENRSLRDARNCVLATQVTAQSNVPAHDNSAMDGFAINTSDIKAAATELRISQTIQAGHPGSRLEAGTAARIFTGAAIPPGANAVVIQENASYDAEKVSILQVPSEHENIRPAGHDIRAGELILKQGRRLQPQDIALLASLGIAEVQVYRPLCIAIVNTGDELVAPGQSLEPGQIYDSNSYSLRALLQTLGMQVLESSIVKDDLASTEAALADAADQADCIISSGGVSVGDADYVKQALGKLGELSLWKLAIKPGKPFAYGRVKQTPFFGLPGNPVAVFVTFLLLVKPYLLKLQGAVESPSPSYRIKAAFAVTDPNIRQEYLRVNLQQNSAGELILQAFPNQSSSVMSSLVQASGLAVIPAHTTIKEGELLEYLPFTGLIS